MNDFEGQKWIYVHCTSCWYKEKNVVGLWYFTQYAKRRKTDQNLGTWRGSDRKERQEWVERLKCDLAFYLNAIRILRDCSWSFSRCNVHPCLVLNSLRFNQHIDSLSNQENGYIWHWNGKYSNCVKCIIPMIRDCKVLSSHVSSAIMWFFIVRHWYVRSQDINIKNVRMDHFRITANFLEYNQTR